MGLLNRREPLLPPERLQGATFFCDFCDDLTYREHLTYIGDGSVVKPGPQQTAALTYRKACPPCAATWRQNFLQAQTVEKLGPVIERMVGEGATQAELDELVGRYGLDKELVGGFGIPEPDNSGLR